MPTKDGQNTLYEAIYYDETKLTRQTNRKAWSIADGYQLHQTSSTRIATGAASPTFEVRHFKTVEGRIITETILDFIK